MFSAPPMARGRWFDVSAKLSFRLGPTIFRSNTQPRTLVPIAEPLGGSCDVDYDLWWSDARAQECRPRLMTNSWMRYHSNRVRYLNRRMSFESRHRAEAYKSWLAQANHIFAHLETTSHLEDYMCATRVIFTLRCVPDPSNTRDPEGFLFICPPEDFRAGDWLRWPDCPAYWTLDSSGASRLSAEDARILGFPIIHIETTMTGLSWDDAVYDKLRLFHQHRAFDPVTEEAARHLRYLLFKLSPNVATALACGEDTKNRYECDMKNVELCREFGHYMG
ncbi:hypothetical protein DFH08DRAFT_907160 [Mycena albidolilacea]|uniref:Uncharacterized protein n=1 Tax=Mycena albidolilacea TaxID=1033008 RepID=A0AAD6YXI5_9AGAR|nr:hypothetical protein DFH08DRAFT_907160 [Mycena albidolilacea]